MIPKRSPPISKKRLKKKAQRKEMRDVRTISLMLACPSCHLLVLGLSAPPSPSVSGMRVLKLSTLLSPFASGVYMPELSAPLSPFASGAPVLGSSALPSLSSHLLVLWLSALPSPFASDEYVPRLSILSTFGAPVPGSFALPSPSGHLPMLKLSTPPASSRQLIPTLSTLSAFDCLLMPG